MQAMARSASQSTVSQMALAQGACSQPLVIGDDGKQFVKGVSGRTSCKISLTLSQLLNRNPQNRLGAKRGAAELKEHPFFSQINWELLYRKQVTPPFKPLVDSDESVANFDPEFTNSSLQDAGIQLWDEDEMDAPASSTRHNYLGPGGSLTSPAGQHMGNQNAVPIQRPGAKPTGEAGSPLTSSLQENFRGFTYTGESLMPVSHLGDQSMDEPDDVENAVDDDEDDDEDDLDEDYDGDGMRTRRQSDVDME